MSKHTILCAAFVASTLSFAGVASAVTEVDASDVNQTTFDPNILNNDLIENGAATVSSVTTNGNVANFSGDVAPFNSFSNLTDGLASTKVNNNDISHDTYFDTGSYGSSPAITYNLNTAANPLGYTLTSINSISGWADSRGFSDQRYQVLIALVGTPTTFNLLQDETYTPFTDNNGSPNSSQVTLTDLGATGVAAIEFKFLPNANTQNNAQVFREIDVVGVPTSVPEPSTVAALIGGAGMLLGLRRRRA